MKTFDKLVKKLKEKRGISLIIVAIVLSALLGLVALAVDVGYLYATRNELQNIADGAALAGARTLGRLYECNGNIATCQKPMPYPDQLTYVADSGAIKTAINDVASKNPSAGQTGITISDSDIVIGNWDGSTKTLSPTPTSPDAVRVTARRDGSANGPIVTFFAKIIGINTVNVSAVATAALTGESTAGPGGLPIPVAINKTWLTTLPCNQDLTFHPSSANVCAGWNAYDGNQYKPTGGGMRQLIEDITAGRYSSPETVAGTTKYDFTNGNLATVFTHNTIQDLFDTMRVLNKGPLDMDNDPTTWTTAVAVFDDSKVGCSPSGLVTIEGFATITITRVSGPPESTIYATIKCDNVEPGRGGGGYYGTKGSIPGLVQ